MARGRKQLPAPALEQGFSTQIVSEESAWKKEERTDKTKLKKEKELNIFIALSFIVQALLF